MIFLRVGWMDRYRGLTRGDEIKGGGAFVAEHGYGHEIFNFLPWNGRVYGYVQPTGAAHNDVSERKIRIDRLGDGNGDESVSGILAVWVATRPEGGTVIVGWYTNATIFRDWQKPPAGSQRHYDGNDFGYYVTAAAEDATLLPRDARVMLLPKGKGGIGQSNIWYASEQEEFRKAVQAYVATGYLPPPSASNGPAKQPDPFLRQQIERAAVKETVEHFTRLGYKVDSVEKDNRGWDLDAVHPILNVSLKLEVKGLSGDEICVDVTPNEYHHMTRCRDVYRLCVVTNAMHKPRLSVFAYSAESDNWEEDDGRVLRIEEVRAARCRAADSSQ